MPVGFDSLKDKQFSRDLLLKAAADQPIDFTEVEITDSPSAITAPIAKAEVTRIDILKEEGAIDFSQVRPLMALYIAAVCAVIGLGLLLAPESASVLFARGLLFALGAGCIGGHYITGDAGVDGSFSQAGSWTVRAVGGAAFFLIVFFCWLYLIVWPFSQQLQELHQKTGDVTRPR
jgi:hypothetical protein